MSLTPPSSRASPTQPAFDGADMDDFFDESVEFVDDYGPEKLHPVTLGDTFADSRYKVIRKLGAGSFSTVWLSHDRKNGTYVAIKIATVSL